MRGSASVWVVCVAMAIAPIVAHADRGKAKEAFRRGMAEFYLDHFDEAIRHFTDGFREEPEPAFLYNIGNAHARALRPAAAIEYYRKYLQLIPDGAPERAEVEPKIALEQEHLAAQEKENRAHPVPPVPPAPPATDVVVAPTVPPRAPARRRGPGGAIAGALVAVVVGGVAVGVGLGVGLQPRTAPSHPGTDGTVGVMFP